MKKTDIEIVGRFRPIPMTFTIPDGNGPFPFVVMLHGTYSCRHEMFGGYDILSSSLASKGIASVQFDFAGCGDSKADYLDYSMAGALADCSDVIGWSVNQIELDRNRMGLIGWSQGAQLAILKASEDCRVKSLILWAPTLSMKDFWSDEKKIALDNGIVFVNPGFRESLYVSRAWFDEAEFNDALRYLPDYTGSILAIAGTEDEFRLFEGIPSIMEKCGSKDKKSIVIDGANHIFNIDASDGGSFPNVVEYTVSRFTETL